MKEVISKCIEHKLTPNQIIYLYTLYLKVANQDFITSTEQLSLDQEGYIGYDDNAEIGSNWILRNKGRNLFEVREESLDSCWLEFKGLFPIKSGVRRLHDQQDKLKLKYITLIKNKPELHREIILGLNNEFKARKEAINKRQFMADWKTMSSYLNSTQWKVYLDYREELTKTNTGTTESI